MAHAIPTEYRGIRFRSRLEAQWAAFFDLMCWRWHYEPIDLNGYIPDFIVDGTEPILFEVKPIITVEEFANHYPKIVKSGWVGPYVILGAFLFTRGQMEEYTEPEWADGVVLGSGLAESKRFHDEQYRNKDGTFLEHRPWEIIEPYPIYLFHCAQCNRFYPGDGPCCSLCGYMWRPGDGRGPDDDLIRSAMASAKNLVQWKGGFSA